MKKLLLLLLATPLIDLYGQIVVNELMYAPTSPNTEWFELYNKSSESVNLQNWKWKDATNTLRTLTTQNLYLDPASFIIICQDSITFKTQFSNFHGPLIQTTWSLLNNTGDSLVIINHLNVRVEQLSFSSSWGGNTGGNSLERIYHEGPLNEGVNWGSSIDHNLATPGRQNSITPKLFDLNLRSLTFNPLFPSAGQTLFLNVIVKNTGINQAANFAVNFFDDLNNDSIPENTELLNSHSFSVLNTGDSLLYSFAIENVSSGVKQYIAKVIYGSDLDSMNNTLIRMLNVGEFGSGEGGIVINEIMYDPLSAQSEWIELYNASGQSVNIKNWKYKETLTTIVLSASDIMLNPGDYFILAHDTTLYATFHSLRNPKLNQHIKFASGISLSNSGETIVITDSLSNIVDAVTFYPDWNNPELSDTKGISLERVNPALGSNDRNNWSSSARNEGGTPGELNSIYTKNMSATSTVSITPNPFSPDNDGFEDFALIKYRLNVKFAQMRVRVYDIKGRLVKTLANNQITGSEGTIIFNGYDDDNRKLRIGIYVLLIEAVDHNGGSVDHIKAPVVVAAKL